MLIGLAGSGAVTGSTAGVATLIAAFSSGPAQAASPIDAQTINSLRLKNRKPILAPLSRSICITSTAFHFRETKALPYRLLYSTASIKPMIRTDPTLDPTMPAIP